VRSVPAFDAILDDFPVSAVYAGHWHGTFGEWETRGPYRDGRRVPVLLSGSAHHGTFLVTRFAGDKMYVWVMSVDHFHDAVLRVRYNGAYHDASDLGSIFQVCDGCARYHDYVYDLR